MIFMRSGGYTSQSVSLGDQNILQNMDPVQTHFVLGLLRKSCRRDVYIIILLADGFDHRPYACMAPWRGARRLIRPVKRKGS